MNIYSKEGLDFRKDDRGDFVINPYEENLSALRSMGIKNIEINDSLGRPPRNLNFLSRADFIEGVSLVSAKNLDLNPIQDLHNLKIINIPFEHRATINFDNFPFLTYCQIVWSDKIQNFNQLRLLETLILTAYKKDDLVQLSQLTSLRKLSLIKSTIKFLHGIENFEKLEFVELTLLKNLTSLEGIENLKNLIRLDLESVSIIGEINSLSHLRNLELLAIHDCKNIQSLKPIAGLSKLQVIYLSGNTNIVDGDMTPLIGRKDASFGTRKHYSHKAEEIDKINNTIRPKQTWDW